jgi:serine/threonine protein kinase
MSADPPRRRSPPQTPLAVGARLGRYEVRKVLGRGAGGIVYRVVDLEADTDLDQAPDAVRDLALREYLPAGLARRDGPVAVVPRSPAQAEAFAQGLETFVSQGRQLAGLSHPSLAQVRQGWQANGTAYRTLTLVHGRNLNETLQARGRAPSESSLRAIMAALLDALETLHGAGLVHGGIAPHSVMLEPNGRPVLLDLDQPRDPGNADPLRAAFAAPECQGEPDTDRIGPWTDFYALGATLHFLISAKAPPPAAARSDGDQLGLKLQRRDGRYSSELLGLIDWMLAPQPADRPQQVAQLRDGLAGQGLPERHLPAKRDVAAARLRRHRRRLWLGAALALLLAVAVVAGLHLSGLWRLRLPWS